MTKSKVKAFVLKDGNVISSNVLDQFAVKESQQVKDSGFHGEDNVIIPRYDPKTLAQLTEYNTYHYRAIKTKAWDTVGLGWRLVPVDGKDNPNDAQKAAVEEFLNNPHPDQTLSEVLSKWVEDYEAMGNGYLEVIREGEKVIGLEHIPAHTVRVKKLRQEDRRFDDLIFVQIRGINKRYFKKIGAPYDIDNLTGEAGQVPPDRRANEVIHILNYTPCDDYYGTPDVLPATGALLGDKQREEYNIDFFENFAIPAYAVTVAGAELDDETINQIKQYFQRDLKDNRHSTLVLSAPNPLGEGPGVDFTFERLAVDMQEASFRLYRLDNRDEILTAHGVPPYRAGIAETGSLGGSTATESTEIYKQSIINPRQQMIEARLNKLLRDNFKVTDWVFEFEEIDTRDEERDTRIYQALFALGAMTPNEIREELGDEKYDDPVMDLPHINGTPVGQSSRQQQQPMSQPDDVPPAEASQDLIAEIKSLHRELIEVVKK